MVILINETYVQLISWSFLIDAARQHINTINEPVSRLGDLMTIIHANNTHTHTRTSEAQVFDIDRNCLIISSYTHVSFKQAHAFYNTIHRLQEKKRRIRLWNLILSVLNTWQGFGFIIFTEWPRTTFSTNIKHFTQITWDSIKTTYVSIWYNQHSW